MKKVRVTAVSGTIVNADGKLLYCIGNIPVRVGDYVWTDGRCVYGNVMEGGEPVIPITQEEVIPLYFNSFNETYFDIFGYYDERKYKNIKELEKENNYYNHLKVGDYMINDKKNCKLISEEDYSGDMIPAAYGDGYRLNGENFSGFLDAEINKDGSIFVLEDFKEIYESQTINYRSYKHWGRYGGNIYKDKEKIGNYTDVLCSDFHPENVIVYDSDYNRYVRNDKKLSTCVTVTGGSIDTEGVYNLCFNRDYWINNDKSYVGYIYVVDSDITPRDEKEIEEMRSHDGQTAFSAEGQAVIMISDKKNIIINTNLSYSFNCTEESESFTEYGENFTARRISVNGNLGDYNYECNMADHKLKIPLQDGFYFTFALPNAIRNPTFKFYDELINPDEADAYIIYNNARHAKPIDIYFPDYPVGKSIPKDQKFTDPYKVNIYDKNNNLVLENLEYYSLPFNIEICKIKGKYLIYPYHQRTEGTNTYKSILAIVTRDKENQKTKFIKEIRNKEESKNQGKDVIALKNFRLREMANIRKWKATIYAAIAEKNKLQ